MRQIFLLLFFLNTALTNAQIINARILDKDNNPISYAHVYNQVLMDGALSNEDGVFNIKYKSKSDTIRISHVSHEAAFLTVKQLLINPTVILNFTANNLNEITILSENTYAYTLLKKCKKRLRKNHEIQSKIYLSLETESAAQPMELIQAFYNGNIKNNSIEDLKLKAGRIALAPQNKRYFVSLNTTHAITSLNLTSQDRSIPLNPFQVRNHKKRYDLTLLSNKTETIQHILFKPTSKPDQYFYGELWIDKNTFKLEKIALNITDSNRFPYRPINITDKLENIDLTIEISFDKEDDLVSVINFSYQFNYLYNSEEDQSIEKIKAKGIIYAYDKKEAFILPDYEYTSEHNDYRKISFFPYDSTFWANSEQLALSNNQRKQLSFFEKEGTVINFYDGFLSKEDEKNTFFEINNIFWNKEKRWKLSPKQYDINKVEMIPQTQIEVQWLMQVDQYTPNEFSINSYTVLDVFKTKYYLEDLPKHNAYLNIYFDICEVERRALERGLQEIKSVKEYQLILEKAKEHLSSTLKKFKLETNYGNNIYALKTWNEYIYNEIGVNNFVQLGVEL